MFSRSKYSFGLALLPFAFAPFAFMTGCTELDSLRERTDAQEQQLASLRQENGDFHDAYYKTKEALEGEIAKSQKTIDSQQRQLDEAKTLQTQHEKDLDDQLRTRTLELAALRNESADQKKLSDAQIAQLQQGLQAATSERDAAMTRLTEMDKKITAEQAHSKTLQDQVATLNVGNQQLGTRLDTMQKDLAKQSQDLKTERDARAIAEKKNTDLDTKLAAAEKARTDAEKARAQSEQALNEAKSQAGDLEKKVEVSGNAAQDLQKANSEKAALQSQIEKMKTTASASLADDPRLKTAESKINAALAQAPSHKGAEVRLDKSGLRVILPSDLLFDKGGIILSDSGKSLIQAVAPSVAELAKDRHVIVEGHTDNQAISGDLPFADNWGLGFARADRVRAFLTESSVASRNLTAQTRAQNSPLASNETPEGRFQNRRVEIVIGAPAGG